MGDVRRCALETGKRICARDFNGDVRLGVFAPACVRFELAAGLREARPPGLALCTTGAVTPGSARTGRTAFREADEPAPCGFREMGLEREDAGGTVFLGGLGFCEGEPIAVLASSLVTEAGAAARTRVFGVLFGGVLEMLHRGEVAGICVRATDGFLDASTRCVGLLRVFSLPLCVDGAGRDGDVLTGCMFAGGEGGLAVEVNAAEGPAGERELTSLIGAELPACDTRRARFSGVHQARSISRWDETRQKGKSLAKAASLRTQTRCNAIGSSGSKTADLARPSARNFNADAGSFIAVWEAGTTSEKTAWKESTNGFRRRACTRAST